MSKNKPDDRSDNASKIKRHIAGTKSNIEAAEEMIAVTDDKKMKEELRAKNQRREEAIPQMEAEMRQEQEFANQRRR